MDMDRIFHCQVSQWPLPPFRSCIFLPSGKSLAERIGSRALRADAVESITCGWLSCVVVVGLTGQYLLGAWWIDAVTSLGIVWFVVKEGREAWQRQECCDHCD